MSTWIKWILHFVYPSICLGCHKNNTDWYNLLCDDCICKLKLPPNKTCMRCGNELTLHNSTSDNKSCMLCLEHPPYFHHFKAALVYNNLIATMVANFKYYDRPELYTALSKLLIYSCYNLDLRDIDYVIAMPIHYWRLIGRKYNQVELLAKEFAKWFDLKYSGVLVKKHKHTKAQATLGLEQRKCNISGSFIVNPKFSHLIKGANILLIDDIVTTGNTVNEVSKVLSLNGAKTIRILCLARVEGSFEIY